MTARQPLMGGLFALLVALSLAPNVRAQGGPPPPSEVQREPSAREVVRMALLAARRLGPSRMRELVRRARLTGLTPELRLSVERGFAQDLSSTLSEESDRTNEAVEDDLQLQATLTFELPRLLFAPEEVRLLSIERWLEADRRKLASEVVRLYFQRRRLRREQLSSLAPDAELADALAEVEALLDALTEGAFTRALGARRAP